MPRFTTMADMERWADLHVGRAETWVLKRVEHGFDLVYRVWRNRAGTLCIAWKGAM